MKILLLTPIYPNKKDKTDTPVVHYFAKEWVKQGHEVVVIHCVANFYKIIYIIVGLFKKFLEKKIGTGIRIEPINSEVCVIDNVNVKRIPLVRFIPHTRYSKRQIGYAVAEILSYCKKQNFNPDVLAYHWINPQAEIVHSLKAHFNVPICYVAHDGGNDFKRLYKDEYRSFFSDIDLIGYRCKAIKDQMEKRFSDLNKPYFYCYSGVPEGYIDKNEEKHAFDKLNTIIYVGLLIKRKNPLAIMEAAQLAYQDKEFSITYIGSGTEMDVMQKMIDKEGLERQVKLLGRVARDEVIKEMKRNEIFVMISRGETFGLVYLEAMAKGCITVASYNEGFDGIIQHGINGFLCDAGDVNGLANVLRQIRSLSMEDIDKISFNAMETARRYTDCNVARDYVGELELLIR